MFQAEHDHSWDLVDHLEDEDLPGWAIALIVIGTVRTLREITEMESKWGLTSSLTHNHPQLHYKLFVFKSLMTISAIILLFCHFCKCNLEMH
jgi:hypothetical protein